MIFQKISKSNVIQNCWLPASREESISSTCSFSLSNGASLYRYESWSSKRLKPEDWRCRLRSEDEFLILCESSSLNEDRFAQSASF